jgi:hypothetical protein
MPAMPYFAAMDEATSSEDRDKASGRFLSGNKRGGRPKGARDRHSRNFLNAFADDFEQNGVQVIAKVREEQPAAYLKIACDLLPREATLDISVDILADVTTTLEAFRVLRDTLGIDPKNGMRRLRRLAPQIGHDAFES